MEADLARLTAEGAQERNEAFEPFAARSDSQFLALRAICSATLLCAESHENRSHHDLAALAAFQFSPEGQY